MKMAIELQSPVQGRFREFITENLKTRPMVMAAPDRFKGQTLALCGAGPSLVVPTGYDHVFACNSALPYLTRLGAGVTAGCGIDQTPGLLTEWLDPPDVPYFVASSCDPALVRHLIGYGRQVVFFHSCVGIEDEFEFYCDTWPPTFMVGTGHTVVSRILALAQWMGFAKIDVYGADCAFTNGDVCYADGSTATEAYGKPLMMEGVIDGRTWRTRPDMLMAAVELARIARDDDSVTLVGDTLPNALQGKDEKFLESVCRRLAPGELVGAA